VEIFVEFFAFVNNSPVYSPPGTEDFPVQYIHSWEVILSLFFKSMRQVTSRHKMDCGLLMIHVWKMSFAKEFWLIPWGDGGNTKELWIQITTNNQFVKILSRRVYWNRETLVYTHKKLETKTLVTLSSFKLFYNCREVYDFVDNGSMWESMTSFKGLGHGLPGKDVEICRRPGFFVHSLQTFPFPLLSWPWIYPSFSHPSYS
jgi:hypothetical protein